MGNNIPQVWVEVYRQGGLEDVEQLSLAESTHPRSIVIKCQEIGPPALEITRRFSISECSTYFFLPTTLKYSAVRWAFNDTGPVLLWGRRVLLERPHPLHHLSFGGHLVHPLIPLFSGPHRPYGLFDGEYVMDPRTGEVAPDWPGSISE